MSRELAPKLLRLWIRDLVTTAGVHRCWSNAFTRDRMDRAEVLFNMFRAVLYAEIQVTLASEYLEIFKDCRSLRIPRTERVMGHKHMTALSYLEHRAQLYFGPPLILLPSCDKVCLIRGFFFQHKKNRWLTLEQTFSKFVGDEVVSACIPRRAIVRLLLARLLLASRARDSLVDTIDAAQRALVRLCSVEESDSDTKTFLRRTADELTARHILHDVAARRPVSIPR